MASEIRGVGFAVDGVAPDGVPAGTVAGKTVPAGGIIAKSAFLAAGSTGIFIAAPGRAAGLNVEGLVVEVVCGEFESERNSQAPAPIAKRAQNPSKIHCPLPLKELSRPSAIQRSNSARYEMRGGTLPPPSIEVNKF